jgi:carboxyl-terminal processing protease
MTLRFPLPPVKSLISMLILAALIPFATGQTVDGKPGVKSEVITQISDEISRRAFVPGIDFTKLPEFLASEQKKIDKAANDEEFARAVNQALDKFGASHIVLWTPGTAEQRFTGSSVGIGISGRMSPKGLEIVRVVPETSASEAALAPGDTITEVGGQKVSGTRGISGPEGSTVNLTVLKQDGQTITLALTRHRFSTVHDAAFTWVDRDTAKITLYTFDNTYNRTDIEYFMGKAATSKNLILDLRDNGGGVVANLQHFLSFLIPNKEPIGTFISRITLKRFEDATHGDPKDLAAVANFSTVKLTPLTYAGPVYKGHIIVLINRGSGSATEIAAAGLRDTVGAEIVGSKSAGAVLISILVPAADGFMLQFPLSDYITIKGKRLEGNGVTPDLDAKDAQFRLPNSPDASLDKALAYIDDLRHTEEKLAASPTTTKG